MLQQTQVDRVKPFYRAFLARFPTVRALARAPLPAVLVAWRGLGYNRRAKLLREAARAIVARHGGRVPRDVGALVALTGVGAYTAGAVRAFAWNEPSAIIETNIRNVFTREFFPRRKAVRDADLMPFIEAALDRKDPRRWYAALMDYGSALKKEARGLNARSAHYAKQKPFKGSTREARGAILAVLTATKKPATIAGISRSSGIRRARLAAAARALAADGLIECAGETLFLSGAR